MKNSRPASARGFTLIEMVIVTAIIGLLATVAIPTFRLMNYRAKAAERGAVTRAIKNSISQLRVKDGSFGAGVTGNWNPALPLVMGRRPFVASAAGWDKLDLIVDGTLYYSYMFTAQEGGGGPPQFTIFAQGDIDSDGQVWVASYTYELHGNGWAQTSADNPPMYDATVF
jgi:prepilin-type N-terminal cleavage/methylation domain-containing protein